MASVAALAIALSPCAASGAGLAGTAASASGAGTGSAATGWVCCGAAMTVEWPVSAAAKAAYAFCISCSRETAASSGASATATAVQRDATARDSAPAATAIVTGSSATVSALTCDHDPLPDAVPDVDPAVEVTPSTSRPAISTITSAGLGPGMLAAAFYASIFSVFSSDFCSANVATGGCAVRISCGTSAAGRPCSLTSTTAVLDSALTSTLASTASGSVGAISEILPFTWAAAAANAAISSGVTSLGRPSGAGAPRSTFASSALASCLIGRGCFRGLLSTPVRKSLFMAL